MERKHVTGGKVYKVWIDIEEYDIAADKYTMLDCLDISCTATFRTERQAIALATKINKAFSDAAGQVTHD